MYDASLYSPTPSVNPCKWGNHSQLKREGTLPFDILIKTSFRVVVVFDLPVLPLRTRRQDSVSISV
ncbi:hypothetical protein T03_3390 [Trichinella britovi]|uniref:Uncharacterized protein n=2 Tax=Trichinella TaxID=6333 RepID=A0A0V1CV59_TRIBR|nr:hypothetical protein T05_11402 [Trichinella murrelli]KRY53205.1 hypothetical protein T03_3390 [Trichinella britovi]